MNKVYTVVRYDWGYYGNHRDIQGIERIFNNESDAEDYIDMLIKHKNMIDTSSYEIKEFNIY